jgi:hypothetical protein
MKKIIGFIKEYFTWLDKRMLFLSALFTGLAIFLNYHFNLNRQIASLKDGQQYICWYFIFLTAFSFAYVLQAFFKNSGIFRNTSFIILLFLAPLIFSWKMVADIQFNFSRNAIINTYWNHVIYWPSKLLVISLVLFLIWKIRKEDQPFYGTLSKNFSAKPYLLMLLIMIPLIGAASTQPDFLAVYPKLKSVSFLSGQQHSGWIKLLYELSYGSDFVSIELFFRGFLIIAFSKWVGKDAILPMACFYCTIHFGKPMGECISSFFGGLILGVVTYHTRTIYGGLMVHLGIAWMMELGGYLGNNRPF